MSYSLNFVSSIISLAITLSSSICIFTAPPEIVNIPREILCALCNLIYFTVCLSIQDKIKLIKDNNNLRYNSSENKSILTRIKRILRYRFNNYIYTNYYRAKDNAHLIIGIGNGLYIAVTMFDMILYSNNDNLFTSTHILLYNLYILTSIITYSGIWLSKYIEIEDNHNRELKKIELNNRVDTTYKKINQYSLHIGGIKKSNNIIIPKSGLPDPLYDKYIEYKKKEKEIEREIREKYTN